MISTLILLSFLTNIVSAQYITNVVVRKFPEKLEGNPAIVVTHFATRMRSPNDQHKMITVYDKNGLPLTIEHFNKRGELIATQTMINDTIRKLVRLRVYTIFKAFKDVVDSTIYSYNENGHLIREEARFEDSGRVTIFTNDFKGFPITAMTYDPRGNLWTREVATYNHEKNSMKVTTFTNDGKKWHKHSDKINMQNPHSKGNFREVYNKQGHRVSYYSNFDGAKRDAEYEYDEKGNWTTMKWYIVNRFANPETKTLESSYYREITYRK